MKGKHKAVTHRANSDYGPTNHERVRTSTAHIDAKNHKHDELRTELTMNM